MKAVIIDNEGKIRASLKKLIEIYCQSVSVVGEATGCSTGRMLILEKQPDLIFLDIEMDDGTGIDLVKSLPELQSDVIFITAHDKYALDGFKCSALDFLLKPIDPEDLVSAIEKAESKRYTLGLQKRVQVLEEHLSKKESEKIVLSDSESIHLIKIDDILWCCAEGSYTRFILVDSREILVSRNLKAYEDILDETKFIRIHHSYLININHISRFERSEGGILVMNNGGTLPVSVRKKDNLMQVLKKWNQNTVIK